VDESKARSDDPELAEGLEEASRLAEEGDADGALEVLLGLEPDHAEEPMLLCMIGATAAHVGAEGMAVDYFRRCLAAGPTEPMVLVTAGAGLASAGDPAAEPALRAAALTAPQLGAARLEFGRYLVRSGLVEQGIEELVTARGLEPDTPEVRRELAIALLLARRVNEALEELEEAVVLDDTDPDSRLLWGLALIQGGEVERAAEELHPLGASLADDGETQVLLALLFSLAGWEEEAWLALSRAEASTEPVDPAMLLEVEDALESGDDAARDLLTEQLAPSALRDRIFR
jgi:predicted Zn-dependent protease